jgi:hypothetical protein
MGQPINLKLPRSAGRVIRAADIVAASGHTLPLAIVGTENFTALPAASLLTMPLFHSSAARLVAS